jgi:hypothetical protein
VLDEANRPVVMAGSTGIRAVNGAVAGLMALGACWAMPITLPAAIAAAASTQRTG